MSAVVRAAELGRSVRAAASIRTRQPLARARVVFGRALRDAESLLAILADELNVKRAEPVDDAGDLFERRVKVLLPKVARRLGSRTQTVLQAARDGSVEFLDGGAVRIAGEEFAADEIEVQAVPRTGQHVAEDDGLVVELDTTLTPELVAEGDARELTRAIQEARKAAGLVMTDSVEIEAAGVPEATRGLAAAIVASVGASKLEFVSSVAKPAGTATLSAGEARFAIRRGAR